MGDVKLAASTQVSKTSISVDHSRVGSMPLTEAPAFIVPPRNLCIREGATAKFEGRVRSMAGGEAGEEMGKVITASRALSSADWIWRKAWFSLDPHIK